MIDRATAADAATLARLDATCFGAEAWSEAAFVDTLASPAGRGWVLRDGDEVCGYVLLVAGGDQADLASIAVAPTRRQAGLGGTLLDHALAAARAEGIREVFLEVRVSNEAALALYRSRGFSVIGCRRAYYRHPVEDARCLKVRLTGTGGSPGERAHRFI